jgi:hypothetical protein
MMPPYGNDPAPDERGGGPVRTAFVLVASVVMCAATFAGRADATLSTAATQQPAASDAKVTLDYEFFKTRVQPIFLAKRPGHARCIACHGSGTPLRLQPVAAGSKTWSEEDSRKNFDTIRRVVVPGSARSRLLVHPLEEKAGGDFYHNGGKHWSSQDDPEWQTLRAFVMGQTAH